MGQIPKNKRKIDSKRDQNIKPIYKCKPIINRFRYKLVIHWFKTERNRFNFIEVAIEN